MRKIISNNKGQFFIAIAIIIIFSLSAIFFYLSSANYSTDASLRGNDINFFVNNVKEEFDKVAELTLANVSGYKGTNPGLVDPAAAFEANLSSFSRFAQSQAFKNGVFLNVSYQKLANTNTTMNASVRLDFLNRNTLVQNSFYAFSNISVGIVPGTLSKGAVICTFNVSAAREFGQPLTNMTANNFVFTINGTPCASPIYTEGAAGTYNFTCTSSRCVSSLLVANVTDTRNIVGYDVIPNSGLTYFP